MKKLQLSENKSFEAAKNGSKPEIMTTKRFENHPGAPFLKPFDKLRTEKLENVENFRFTGEMYCAKNITSVMSLSFLCKQY